MADYKFIINLLGNASELVDNEDDGLRFGD